MKRVLDAKVTRLRNQLDEAIKDLHNLCIHIGSEELSMTISDLRNRLNEPFMFVIVGEVKAGKSSFVNALLESEVEISEVGPQPVTDTIQQILYGEKAEVVEINPHLKKIYQPIEILKEIAIVDTPGTNTIVEEHQDITEQFIPASDLIVFVFEAKNPYRQSAWTFFDFIHQDWGKKIIFVLQQKDLLPEADLRINMEGVEKQARSKGMEAPVVFATSAKWEQEQQKESGFEKVRKYIREHITGGKAPLLKLENNLSTSLNIHKKIGTGLIDRRRQYEADKTFREDVHQSLEKQAAKSEYQVRTLVENLLATYDRHTRSTEAELRSGLSFFALIKRSFASIFSKKASAKVWLENLTHELENDLNRDLKKRLDEGVGDLADNIRQMAKMIDLKIKANKTLLPQDHEIFSDIAEQRLQIIRELEESFGRFMSRAENFQDEALFAGSEAIAPSVATGSGLAVVGIILTAVTQGVVFDITGGVLTTIGLLFAGITSGSQKRKIVREYRKAVAEGRSQMEEEVTEKLTAYVQQIKRRIEAKFKDFDQLLEKEEQQLASLETAHQEIERRLLELQQQLARAKS